MEDDCNRKRSFRNVNKYASNGEIVVLKEIFKQKFKFSEGHQRAS